jgi:hypothetical protein
LTDIDGDPRPQRWAPDAGADQREPASLVLGKSMGIVSFGMEDKDVTAFYGKATLGRPRVGGVHDRRLRFASYRVHGGWLTVAYADQRVVGMATTSRYYTTPSGLGVQSKVGALQRLRWVPCRKAFAQNVNGVQVYFKPRRGRQGENLSSVSMLKGAFKQC